MGERGDSKHTLRDGGTGQAVEEGEHSPGTGDGAMPECGMAADGGQRKDGAF